MSDKLSIRVGSEMVVITINGKPKFYINSINPSKYIMDIAQLISVNYENFNTHVRECSSTGCVEVVGYSKYAILRYDQVLATVAFEKIKELVYEKNYGIVEDDDPVLSAISESYQYSW